MDEFNMTFSQQERKSVCSVRTQAGLGCRRCVYLSVCKDTTSSKERRREDGSKSKSKLKKQSDKSTKSRKLCRNRKILRCVETGEIFHSISEAAEELGVTRSRISSSLKHSIPINGKTLVQESKENMV